MKSLACVTRLFSLLAVLFWCSHAMAQRTTERSETDRENDYQVVVQISKSPEGLVLRYKISKPVEALVFRYAPHFVQDPGGLYAKSWQPEQGFNKRLEDGRLVIAQTSGAAFKHVSMHVDWNYNLVPRAYQPFLKLSDTSFALYSQWYFPYLVEPTREPVSKEARSQSPAVLIVGNTLYQFNSESDETVWFRGRAIQGRAAFEVTPDDGKPLENAHSDSDYMVWYDKGFESNIEGEMFVSTRLPSWMIQHFQEMAPKLEQFYYNKLGQRAADEFAIILGSSSSEGAPSIVGGVTERTIGYSIDGDWTENELVELTEVIAHEVAHLWNSSGYDNPHHSRQVWLHEGSASLMAKFASYELGTISAQQLQQAINRDNSSCLLNLDGRPLSEFGGDPYACGQLLSLLLHLELQKQGRDLWQLWREFLTQVRGSKAVYEEDTLLAIAREWGADASLLEAIKHLSQQDSQAFSAKLAMLTPQLQLPFTIAKPGEDAFTWGKQAVAKLMMASCDSVDMLLGDDHIVVGYHHRCGSIPHRTTVRAAGEFSLVTDGHKAYEYVKDRCSKGEPVILKVVQSAGHATDSGVDAAVTSKADATLTVPCTAQLPAITPALHWKVSDAAPNRATQKLTD